VAALVARLAYRRLGPLCGRSAALDQGMCRPGDWAGGRRGALSAVEAVADPGVWGGIGTQGSVLQRAGGLPAIPAVDHA